MDPYLVLAVAMLALSWWLMRPRHAGRDVAAAADVGSALTRDQRRAASDEIAKMELRLIEQHRELEAALATRIAMLDTLIADADERIADLRQQIEFSDVARRAA